MKMVRRTDPTENLIAAQTSLAEAEARIQALQAEREAKLLEPEFLQDVSRIDHELAALNANIVIFRQREAKMRQRQREHERDRREAEKKVAVASIGEHLSRRMDAASKLDGALAAVANATIELISVDQEIFSNWPDVLSRADLLAYTRASIIEALSTRAPSRPLFAGIVRTVADHGSYDFAAAVDEMNRELMEELQSASIPDPTEDAEAA